MKSNILLTGLFIALINNSCTSPKEKCIEDLLNDPMTEIEVYTSILADNSHFSKFMDKVMSDDAGKKMLTENRSIMKMMCMSKSMDTLMNTDKQVLETFTDRFITKLESDSMVCDHTCTRIMKNDVLNNFFRNQYSKQLKEKK